MQYTDPAAYPALDRGAQLLARAGWDVLFVGIEARGIGRMELRPHPRIRVIRAGSASGGGWGPLKYARFAARTALIAREFKPTWCYASDFLAAPAALLVEKVTGARLIYHEHDAPARGGRSADLALRMRARLASRADIVIVPSAERRQHLPAAAAATATVVWNCPLKEEVTPRPTGESAFIRIVYAGSLSPDRLPLSYVDALASLPSNVTLEIYGYPTVGFPGYPDAITARASERGIAERVRLRGTLSHGELPAALSGCDIGIATLDSSADANFRSMIGASNKTFDYMAAGLPFLVTDEPDWRRTFVDPGFAVACRPDLPDSIYAAILPLLAGDRRREIARTAQKQILNEWNYETQLAPVLSIMSS